MAINVNFLYVINGYYIVMRNDKRIGTLKFLPNTGWTYVAEWDGKSFDDEMLDDFISNWLDDYGFTCRRDIDRIKELVREAVDTWEFCCASAS